MEPRFDTMPASGRTPLEDPTASAHRASEDDHRIGLALSGGGFRAAIFHLGVIRRLEEIGLMRRISVISTVSGGSIVGAYYVIEMERRLKAQPEAERKELWSEIAAGFLKAVDENLRSRALVFTPFYHPILFAKTLLLAPFRKGARSILIQAEYDKWFFDKNTLDELPAVYDPPHIVRPRTRREIRLLLKLLAPFRRKGHSITMEAECAGLRTTHPPAENPPGGASPPAQTGQPPCRGPKVVLNTTSLISGDRKAFFRDTNSRLAELKTSNKNVLTLSQVVGASSGVPGLFPPTPIAGDLLVDGGVSDNQGIEGLDEEGCKILVISDASGQLEIAHTQSTSTLAVLGRMNSILQHQVRTKLLDALSMRYKMEPGFRYAFFHLYLNLKDDPGVGDDRLPSEFIQPVARIRTDLDQFSLIECEALMYHGYTLAGALVRNWLGPLTVGKHGYAAPSVLDQDVLAALAKTEWKDGLFSPRVVRDQKKRALIKKELRTGEQPVYVIRCFRKFPGPTLLVACSYAISVLAATPIALSMLSPIERRFSEWFNATSFGAFSRSLDWIIDLYLNWVQWLTPHLRQVPGLDALLPAETEIEELIKALPAAVKSIPQSAVFVASLLFAVFVIGYVIAFPYWVWLRRWALSLDRGRYRDLTGLDVEAIDWRPDLKAERDAKRPQWWSRTWNWIRDRWMGLA
jgi:predicted acylesterase/phospholipase RssA